jgi:hypothetical protein
MCGHIVEGMLEKMQKHRRCLDPRSPTLDSRLTSLSTPLLGGERLIVLGCSRLLGWGAITVWRACALRACVGSRFLIINCQRVGDLLKH